MGTEKTSSNSNAVMLGEIGSKDTFLLLSLENAELKNKIMAMRAEIKMARDLRENYQEIVNERNQAYLDLQEQKEFAAKLESELAVANTHIENLERYLAALQIQVVP